MRDDTLQASGPARRIRPPSASTARTRAAAAISLAAVLVLAAGCSNSGGVSRSQAAEIAERAAAQAAESVRSEMSGALEAIPVPAPGLELADVERVAAELIDQIPVPAPVPVPAPGLELADVERVAAELVDQIPVPAPGLELADVERVAAELVDQIPVPAPGLTADEIARIVRRVIAGTPSKESPAAYTKLVVDNAIDRYADDGLDAVVDYYSSPASIDGQWYVFVIDAQGTVLGHPERSRIGENLDGPLGTDINGFEFGTQMLGAGAEGAWVPYVYANPASGSLGDNDAFELKHAWVKRHDGLLFGSGWYVDTDLFLPDLIAAAAAHFRAGGLEAMLAFYNDPLGISAGLASTAVYYNSTGSLGGFLSAFSTSADGRITTHIDPSLVGTRIEDLLGPAVRSGATSQGAWITASDNPPGEGPASMRIWVVDVGGSLIGAGWYDNTGS